MAGATLEETGMAPHQPRSASDPRPGNQPFYISPGCHTCGTALVLSDRLDHPDAAESKIWHDEWECPVCRDGIYLDWPEGALLSLQRNGR